MRHYVHWLIGMEKTAASFYAAAAEYFRDDQNLPQFLTNLSKDEDWHEELMEKALECVEEAEFVPPVTLDASTISRIEEPFITAKEKMSAGILTKEDLFECLIQNEFSEWNQIFLYTVNFLLKNKQCFDVAPKIQMHEKYIRRFIEMTPGSPVHMEKFKGLPIVWRDRVLFVDDEPIILSFFRKLFEIEWSVETATNGREALDILRYDYFDVIVSDINMPEMNGIDFYRAAIKIWPEIGERFLFFSANAAAHADFFRANNLQYMLKPAPMSDLIARVSRIASREVDSRLAGMR